MEDITRGEEAKVLLEKISENCKVRHTEEDINLAALERIFEANNTKEPYLVVIGLVLSCKKTLIKSYRKYNLHSIYFD